VRRRDRTEDQLEERRLAGSVRADDRDRGASLDVERRAGPHRSTTSSDGNIVERKKR
jgi:hypothetical protein